MEEYGHRQKMRNKEKNKNINENLWSTIIYNLYFYYFREKIYYTILLFFSYMFVQENKLQKINDLKKRKLDGK